MGWGEVIEPTEKEAPVTTTEYGVFKVVDGRSTLMQTYNDEHRAKQRVWNESETEAYARGHGFKVVLDSDLDKAKAWLTSRPTYIIKTRQVTEWV